MSLLVSISIFLPEKETGEERMEEREQREGEDRGGAREGWDVKGVWEGGRAEWERCRGGWLSLVRVGFVEVEEWGGL